MPPRSRASRPFTNKNRSSSPRNVKISPPLYWKLRWDLGREVLVVGEILVPPAFVVAEGIERVVVVDPHAWAGRIGGERDALFEGEVDAGGVVIPLVEVRLRGGRPLRATGVHGLLIGAQHRCHDPWVDGDLRFEVRVYRLPILLAAAKVAHDGPQLALASAGIRGRRRHRRRRLARRVG